MQQKQKEDNNNNNSNYRQQKQNQHNNNNNDAEHKQNDQNNNNNNNNKPIQFPHEFVFSIDSQTSVNNFMNLVSRYKLDRPPITESIQCTMLNLSIADIICQRIRFVLFLYI